MTMNRSKNVHGTFKLKYLKKNRRLTLKEAGLKRTLRDVRAPAFEMAVKAMVTGRTKLYETND